MTRRESKQAALSGLGATPVVADALDPDQVADALAAARPDAIIHQLTAIAGLDTRHFDRDFAATNRLRTEGTDNLLAAGSAVRVGRVVAQLHQLAVRAHRRPGQERGRSDAGAGDARIAGGDPPPESSGHGRGMDRGIVLRYGMFYSLGTSLCRGGEQFEMVRTRKFPVVGSGAGVWSFIHIADAAEASRRSSTAPAGSTT